MPQQVRHRYQKTLDFSAGNKVNEDLGRGMIYRELALRLSGTATIAMANNTAAKVKRGDEWALVSRIDIIANGTDVIKSISGNALWWMNYFMFGRRPRITPALVDASANNPAFDSMLILPFWMPRSLRPFDTALDARRLSDLKIEVTWGAVTDLNGDCSAISSGKLEVYSLESFNAPNAAFSTWRTNTIERTISASADALQISLPVGPIYRGFLINTTDASADANDILNNFKLKSGTTVFADLPANVLRDWYGMRNGVEEKIYDRVAETSMNLRVGNNNDVGGWYMYDHVTDGRLSEGIDTLGFAEFEIELDVTVGAGTTKVYVIPQTIIPVRAAA